MEKQIELLLQVFANKDATLNETKEALLLLCNSSLLLKDKKVITFEEWMEENFTKTHLADIYRNKYTLCSYRLPFLKDEFNNINL